MTGRVLPASILPGLLEIALKSRLNVQALFNDADIDPDAVGRADRFIQLEQLDAVLTAAFSQAEDPFFGLRVGMDNHYTSLDVLGNLLATADSLGDALALVVDYKDLVAPYLQFDLRQEGDSTVLECRSDRGLNFTTLRTHNEVVVATVVAIARSLVGEALDLRRVGFVHAAPDDTSLYDAFFAVPLAFAAPCNQVVVATACLDTPLPSAFPRYHERLRRVADDQLQRIARAQGVAGQVLERLQQQLGQGEISIEQVAEHLSMTPRTLQRRLRSEGATFVALRDQVRHQRACELLQGEMDMPAIAEALGFSDTANFYHAFKRWEGCSPGAFRRQHPLH